MRCPYCRTENRDERDSCYHCEKDLTMLRLLVNKAKSHFNNALEFAERERYEEAISELHHALDLDNGHVNAHVVLGTLYAKTGRPEEAESEWRAAVELDGRFAKAHDYLVKLRSARRNLPVVRRQRLLILVMVVLLGVLAALYVLAIQPRPGAVLLDEAWNAYRRRDYAAALETAAELRREAPASRAREAADALRILVQDQIANRLEAARLQMERRRWAEAVQSLDALLDADPPAPMLPRIRTMRDRAVADAVEHLREVFEQFRAGEAPVEDIRAALKRVRALPGDAVEAAPVAEIEAEVARIQNQIAVETVLESLKAGDVETLDALESLHALAVERPESPEIAGALEDLVRSFAGERLDGAAAHVEAGRLDAAATALADADKSIAFLPGDAPGLRDRLDALRRDLRASRKTALLESMRTAYAEGAWAETIRFAEELLQNYDLENAERVAAEDRRKNALARLANVYWNWMTDRDYKYETAILSAEEAQKTIDRFPVVRDHLSRAAYPTSQDNLLFYLAVAHHKLQQDADAVEILRRVKTEYPDSNVMNRVDKWLERLAPEAAPSPAAEDAPTTPAAI